MVDDKPISDELAQYYFLGLSQTSFIRNEATNAGGALFTNIPSALGACCNCSTLRVESTPTEDDPLKRVINITKGITDGILGDTAACDRSWVGNRVQRQQGGDKFATTAVVIKLCRAHLDACVDDFLVLENHTSGGDLEDINLKLFDAFHNPAYGQPKMQLEIKADTDGAILSGQLVANVKEVTALTDIRLRAPVNSRHNLTLSFEESILSDMHVLVHIRDCMPGEIEDRDHTGCSPCGPGLYSFQPNQTCTSCPEKAKCSPSTITPEGGFWHSSTKSAQVHECISKYACNFEGRREKLERVAQEAHKDMSVLYYNDREYNQCAEVSS